MHPLKIEYIMPKFGFMKYCGKSKKSKRKFFRKIWIEIITVFNEVQDE